MKIVKAYDLNLKYYENDIQELDIPKGAEILSVAACIKSCRGPNIAYISVSQDHDADTQKNGIDKYEFAFINEKSHNFCIDEYKFLGTIVLRYDVKSTFMYNVFYRKLNKD